MGTSIDKETNEPLVEYQIQEGYCGSATQRCILKSLGCSSVIIPQQKRGESKPDIWCEHICQIGQQLKMEVTTKIVRGDVTYEEFLSTLKRGLESKNCRIGCNFLRSALTGFEGNNIDESLRRPFLTSSGDCGARWKGRRR